MSRQSEESTHSVTQAGVEPEYNPQERALLLQMARESILSSLEHREMSVFTPSAHLSEPRGVFTTLYSRKQLRGCVGFPAAMLPLHRAVVETSRAAASEDPRFYPVRLEEVQDLKISLSILSHLRPIVPDQIEIGRHGLVISHGARRGLLLPQVPVEHGWDRQVFLEQTCMKAGLPPDIWQKGARIEAFTAESFSDEDRHI